MASVPKIATQTERKVWWKNMKTRISMITRMIRMTNMTKMTMMTMMTMITKMILTW